MRIGTLTRGLATSRTLTGVVIGVGVLLGACAGAPERGSSAPIGADRSEPIVSEDETIPVESTSRRRPPESGVVGDTVRITESPSSLGEFEQAILEAHNRVRAEVSPAASPPLPPLEWSESLATLARDWASRCPDGHRPDNDAGENLYWSGGMDLVPAAAVTSWAREATYYDYSSGLCSRDGRASWIHCGHYTQVVWRGTRRVGCAARTDCPGDFENVVVCNYDPPGNVNVRDPRIPRPY